MALIKSILALVVLLSSSNQAFGHGVITVVIGANGVNVTGFGVIPSTSRDGSTEQPYQQDTSTIRDDEISQGVTGVCGRTPAGGSIHVQAQIMDLDDDELPTTDAKGQLTVTLHQVDEDGAGPYACDVSTDGGITFKPVSVTVNVPGVNGTSFARAEDFPLVMQVSNATVCTAGPDRVTCLGRCRNPAAGGPYGSCFAFAMWNDDDEEEDSGGEKVKMR